MSTLLGREDFDILDPSLFMNARSALVTGLRTTVQARPPQSDLSEKAIPIGSVHVSIVISVNSTLNIQISLLPCI